MRRPVLHAARPPRPNDIRQTRHGAARTALCGRDLAKIERNGRAMVVTALGLLAMAEADTCARCRCEADRLRRRRDPALELQAAGDKYPAPDLSSAPAEGRD